MRGCTGVSGMKCTVGASCERGHRKTAKPFNLNDLAADVR